MLLLVYIEYPIIWKTFQSVFGRAKSSIKSADQTNYYV